jgi:hypothetical protein
MSYRSNRLSDWKEVIAMGVGFAVTLVLVVWFTASQEAASYRKFCDSPVTTWDAVWLDLRIDECQCDD